VLVSGLSNQITIIIHQKKVDDIAYIKCLVRADFKLALGQHGRMSIVNGSYKPHVAQKPVTEL
jgi:hypothetical protein